MKSSRTELARFRRFCAEILDLRIEPFQVKIAREVFQRTPRVPDPVAPRKR